ncbi:MAG: hypothetical protein RMA76_04420 [Deltaproteobacteria bacterium]|jgi:methylmalonic aciduria homocystinuria type C protein
MTIFGTKHDAVAPAPQPWERATDALASTVAVAGLDLAMPLDVARYNAAVPEPYRVDTFGREHPLGVLLGNTKALWPCFVEALEDEALASNADPLDTYVMQRVGDALLDLPYATEAYFVHEPPPRRVAMQRLADLSGLAPLSETTHLNVHPEYGPWIALRALVVIDVDGPAEAPTRAEVCVDCASTCGAQVTRAITSGDWRDWLAVREACPVGRTHRYSDAQIRYHYEKNRDALRRFAETGVWTNDEGGC